MRRIFPLCMLIITTFTSIPSYGIDCKYSAIARKMVLFEEGNLYGYKNTHGETVIKPQYQWALPFEDAGYAYADGFFINPKGKAVVEPLHYDNSADFISEGLRRYVKKGKVGFVDICLNVKIKAQYDWANQFKQGVTGVCIGCQKVFSDDGEHNSIEGGLYGAIDRTGKVIIPVKYSKEKLDSLIDALRH